MSTLAARPGDGHGAEGGREGVLTRSRNLLLLRPAPQKAPMASMAMAASLVEQPCPLVAEGDGNTASAAAAGDAAGAAPAACRKRPASAPPPAWRTTSIICDSSIPPAATALRVFSGCVTCRRTSMSRRLLAVELALRCASVPARATAVRSADCAPEPWPPGLCCCFCCLSEGSASIITALRSRRCSLRWCEFHRFLMALSVRPGSSFTISDHLVPSRATASTMVLSSSSLQGAFCRSGLRWLCQRSRHCLPSLSPPS
mmetsp:Transcript_25691/g.86164  ORF Transcript_25691/g.86164 Transcript_25691/m.86164 type:complete len:258 (+) Transcript_25691:404-1177(+)